MGHDAIQGIVALCLESVLWTIYCILVIVMAGTLLRKGRSKMSLVTFGVIFVLFSMDSATCIIDINNAICEIPLIHTSKSLTSLADRYALTDHLPWPIESVLFGFMSKLGDSHYFIWRVSVFDPDRRERWVFAIPIALLVGSFITSSLIAFCVTELVKDPSIIDLVDPPFCKNVQLSSYCMTLATTGIATSLISYKAWQHRRTIGCHLRSLSKKTTRSERVMIILVESGILYFLLFLEAMVTDNSNVIEFESSTPALAFASDVWTYMTSHILGIYPVTILLLAHSQTSCIESATIGVISLNISGGGHESVVPESVAAENNSSPRMLELDFTAT